ncbi:MAG: metallophosphoesterase [Clostridium sp.]|nr:metallophosphoesterase [Clostridium sp.]
MRLPFVILIILLAVGLAADLYIWRILRRRCRSTWPARIQAAGAAALTLLWGVIALMPSRGGDDRTLDTLMWLLFTYLSFYIPKYIFIIFDLAASIPKLWRGKRLKFFSMIGFVLAIIACLTIWWGALLNRYRTQIIEEDIWIPDLPEAFEGYRIVQFSDFHVGTYGRDTTFVDKVVGEINSLGGDMIVFTGDIVSRRTSELLPFVAPLSKLHAPDGVYSVLGNHDYGDYYNWPNDEAKRQNMSKMIELQKEMGWHLLNNEHVMIRRGDDKIALIGVENVGDPPFHTYGSLPDAYPNASDNTVKILLSHNPAHWDQDIADNPDNRIALTLSGHTHAMQISLFGMSPARMRYKTWGGLYHDREGDHQLYVNIGVGTVGVPMRIGATPEITVLTLRRGTRPSTEESTTF